MRRVELSLLSLDMLLFVAGPLLATEASVERAGSWMEAWLLCAGRGSEATVEAEEGRDISWPIDGREGLSS